MDKLFLDANIFFAAVDSSKGASRAIFELAKAKKLKLYSCDYAIHEARINIEDKLGLSSLPLFYTFVSYLTELYKYKNIDISEEILSLINQKDYPVLVSALALKSDFLVSFVRKAFKRKDLVNSLLPIKFLLPGEYLQNF